MVESRNEAAFLFEVGTPVPVSKGKRGGYFVVSLGKLHQENLGLIEAPPATFSHLLK